MERLTSLDRVLFPIVERPVLVDVGGGPVEQVASKRAIVNADTRKILGVVGRGYRVVTNAQALQWAVDCCRTIFPETHDFEWEPRTVDAPVSGKHCAIDLVHRTGALDFACVPGADRPEAYGPFVRLTNSYNGLRALSFEIGFMRKVCSNGMISPDAVVRFSFNHSRSAIGSAPRFDVPSDRLQSARASFTERVNELMGIPVPASFAVDIVLRALEVREPVDEDGELRPDSAWIQLERHIAGVAERYFRELGPNAYALCNVITDLATRPLSNAHLRRERGSLQRLAGIWFAEIGRRCREPAFDWGDYLSAV